ncbi:hypothetical protein J7M23_10095 [Candidatus Sumerlaeota bacterium]|nr:hypothetical protein [Candidatus Sumerlaeota bacterium]
MRNYLFIHLTIGLLVLFFIIGGGSVFFRFLFSFLLHQEVFGPPLMNRLMAMVFLAFFSMLIFSNLIITLSTGYISREVDFFMGLPLRHQDIFWLKLGESILYSSWAFAILSFPIFIAFGQAKGLSLDFYILSILLVVPFLLIPAGIGALLTMFISAFLPARRTRTLAFALAVLSVLIIVVMLKLMGIQRVMVSPLNSFDQIMGILNIGAIPLLPNFWLTRGLLALAENDYGQFCYWFLMLLSTALICMEVCYWFVPKLYYKGWTLSRESASRTYTSARNRRLSFYTIFDSLCVLFPRQWRPIFRKDVRTFWRDPAQWTQLLILFGLLVIYVANLRSAAQQASGMNVIIPKWKTILSFFNLGATCFVLSILSTRFVYPMLSLEGKQQWAIGLSPLKRTAIVWEKYWFSWTAAFVLTEVLMIFSNIMLQVDTVIFILSVVTVFVMSFALISLAVGLGALMPNFKEDNPARIANGLGGTLNAILSLIYVGITIAMEAVPAYLYSIGQLQKITVSTFYIVLYAGIFVLVQFLAIVVPLYLGLRHWEKLEF